MTENKRRSNLLSGSSDTSPQKPLEAGADKDLSRRLRLIIAGESIASFARRVGVSRQWLHDILNGRPVSLATLSSIADSTGYSLEWLARGKGMPSGALEERLELVPRLRVQIDQSDVVTFSLADGPPVVVPSELFIQLGMEVENAGVLAAPDDGMSPIIGTADDILIDQSDRKLVDGAIYVVLAAGRLSTRRAVQTEEGTWVFLSEDSRKKPISLIRGAASENLSIGGRVRFVWRKL
ncbi:LexA family transcriptional regulator [Microvirga sp. M2]|uniref:LexA family transcriptional regulator n=1 Tax=Microvirga sp. M2 TaxID=3073270 RepID=UPI0039C01217